MIAKLNTVGYQSRPDIVFETKLARRRLTIDDAQRKMRKIKLFSSKIRYPKLGKLKELVLIGHGEAGVKSHPDKTRSVGGHVTMLCNTKTYATCVLNWKSKKIRRVVNSFLAGEALATTDTIGELVYQKAVLKFIFGDELSDIPVIVDPDSQNLYMAVQGSSLVEDA